jgi:hypothetical protein
MKVLVDMTSLTTTVDLQYGISFKKFRITKVYANTNGMGTYSGALLFSVNSLCDGMMYDNNGIVQNRYSFALLVPPANIASWDRLIDDYDWENNSEQRAKHVTITLSNNDIALSWDVASKCLVEIEFV